MTVYVEAGRKGDKATLDQLGSASKWPRSCTGMGIFFTWTYIGHATLPALAGKLQDLTGSLAASQYFAAALVFAMLIVFVALRLLQREPQPG
jgi:fucose permease